MRNSTRLRLLWGLVIFWIATLPLKGQDLFFKTGLIGVNLTNPTALGFGPDGRLYVSQQNGTIFAYNIQRTGPEGAGSYAVTQAQTILAIKNIVNRNDDGGPYVPVPNTGDGNKEFDRQITGLIVTGTATNPVLYVSSSDPRIGGNTTGQDKNLDTNSGTVSKLTWVGTGLDDPNGYWDRIELIRGLPRSEENHATNGLRKVGNRLFIAQGGHTNAGGPSNNLAYLTEYAFAGAILVADLDALEALPTFTDPRTGSKVKYDMRTLDDPTRPNIDNAHPDFPYPVGHPRYNDTIDLGDPFGGNDGLNQAKYDPDGPVQIFASGFRNPYDVQIMENGNVYAWDNGANQTWGGYPESNGPNATNNWVPGEPGAVNNLDNLHLIGNLATYNHLDLSERFYGGHPAPVRANPAGAGLFTHDPNISDNPAIAGTFRTQRFTTDSALAAAQPMAYTLNPDSALPADWPPIPVSMANPKEGSFLMPGVADDAVVVVKGSTNGLAEYTASTVWDFNGDIFQLKGALLAASHNHNLYGIRFDENGRVPDSNNDGLISDLDEMVDTISYDPGTTPLAVIAQGDDDIFAGTIWVVTYGANAITILEPKEGFNCTGDYSYEIDEDGDGYSNADEIDSGSDPCRSAIVPEDFNKTTNALGFLVSNFNDPDDDNDGLLDFEDPFPWDAANGKTTTVPLFYPMLSEDPSRGMYDVGFTGLMTNRADDYLLLWQDKNRFQGGRVEVIPGGTSGLFQITHLLNTNALDNTQQNAFQFGIDVDSATAPFTYAVGLSGPVNPTDNNSAGIFIGTGDQFNYLRLAADTGGVLLTVERNDTVVLNTQYAVPELPTAFNFTFYLSVNPQMGTVQPAYSIGANPTPILLGAPIAVTGDLLAAIRGSYQLNGTPVALAVGMIGTRGGTDADYSPDDPGGHFRATWDEFRVTFDPLTEPGQWTFVHDQTPEDCLDGGCPAQGRHQNAFVQAGDKFYLLGGRETTTVDIYDLATQQWSNGTPAPDSLMLNRLQAVALDGLIYALGGFQTTNFPNEVPAERIWIFNPTANGGLGEWIPGPALPESRQRGGAATVIHQGQIYVVGGNRNGHNASLNDTTSAHVAWFDAYDPVSNTWTALPDAPRARDHFQAVVLERKLYAVGGRRSSADVPGQGPYQPLVPEVDRFNFVTGQWTTLPQNLPTPRAGAMVAALNGEVIVFGGERADSTLALDITEALDITTETWRTLSPMNAGRHGTQAITNSNSLYVAAGSPVRGEGNLRSMEAFKFFGATAPQGSPLVPSSLSAQPSDTLNFAQTLLTDGKDLTFTLQNTGGNQALVLRTATLTGDTAFSFPAFDWPRILPIGTTISVPITFNPDSLRAYQAVLTLTHSGSNQPISLVLTGEGVEELPPVYALNMGGPAYTDAAGQLWSPSTDFLSAVTGQASTFADNNLTFANTDDDVLYQSEVYGEFGLVLPVENGTYNVALHFAEIFFGVEGSGGAGSRVFNVNLEGEQGKLTNYDVYARAGGPLLAIVEEFIVEVNDGVLNIDFTKIPQKDNAKLSAIRVSPGRGLVQRGQLAKVGDDPHFFSQDIGTTADPQTVTLTNAGNAALTIDSVLVVGANAADFAFTITGSTLLPAGSNTTVDITFTPTSDGLRVANLHVFHTGQNSSFNQVSLKGEGVGMNEPPVVINPGAQTHIEGAIVTLPIEASDPDGDPLTFAATNLPTGLAIDPATGLVSGTVASGAAANSPYATIVTVSDGLVPTSVSFTWTILAPGVVNDTDEDGIPDDEDEFALDPNNGSTTPLPVVVNFLTELPNPDPFDVGFTGMMRVPNGTVEFPDQYTPADLVLDGTLGTLTINNIPAGDAYAANNNQKNAFQFGVQVPNETFVVHTRLQGPVLPANPSQFQSVGMFIGNGNQDNYVKLVVSFGSNQRRIQRLTEINGVANPTTEENVNETAALQAASFVDLYLTVDPLALTVTPTYAINGLPGATALSPVSIPPTWLNIRGNGVTAVGLISTSNTGNAFGAGNPFSATWDFLRVTLPSQAPQANDDMLFTSDQTPVSVPILANDVAPDAPLDPATVDLNPSQPGQQFTALVTDQLDPDLALGTLSYDPLTALVTFVPNAGVSGRGLVTYTVEDDLGNISNLATIEANVGVFVAIDPVQQSVLLNQTFEARVRSLSGSIAFDGAITTLAYDTAVLRVSSVVPAPAFAGATVVVDTLLGSITFEGSSTSTLSGDTTLLTILFETHAEADNTPLLLGDPTALLSGTDTLPSSPVNGSVIVTDDDPLPISLRFFRGQQAADDVDLTWETASESQNDYFTLQRADEGFAFEEIAQVVGAGESSRALTYEYTDPMAAAYARERGLGNLFYRLWQTDFDGTRTLAGTVRVPLEGTAGFEASAFPNPFEGNFTVSYQLTRAQRVSVQLYDARGVRLRTQEIESLAGRTSVGFEQLNLPAGVYLLRVQSQEGTATVRLVKR